MIHDAFHVTAKIHGAKVAVVGHQHRFTYRQLRCEALRLARELQRLGARPGDRVAVVAPNSVAAAIAIWASFEAECVLVPMHAASKPDALSKVIQLAEPRWVVSVKELTNVLKLALAFSPSIERIVLIGAESNDDRQFIGWQIREETPEIAPLPPTSTDDALAAIIFTSGSTGEPKGVMLSHANMQAGLRAVLAYLPVRADDVFYSALPLSSSYGLYQLVMCLAVGATLLWDRSFSFPAQSLALMAAEKATVLSAVPTMLAWLGRSPLLDKHDLTSLRIVTSAAAALPTEHARRFRERLPKARLYVMYGQTECKRISYLDPDDLDKRAGSVGRGMPYQDHAVVDDSGKPVRSGETGELVVRGPHVMLGYWRAEEATARKLRPLATGDGRWLHTDDLFRADPDGYLYYVGRRDDILKIGGHKVSPREIEEVLCAMPEIAEAAVVGIPDETWGEVARAHVVFKEGSQCSAEDVIRFCMPRLQGFMVPRAVVIMSALPKTESGKIKTRELR